MSTPAIILGNGINALTAARCLGRLSVPVYLLGPDKKDIAYYSRYAKVLEQPADITVPTFIAQIRKTAETSDSKPVLICAADKYLQILSSHREQLQEFCRLTIPSPAAIDTVLDKGLFGEFCEENDLPAPRSWAPETRRQLDGYLGQITFPVLIKPTIAHNADDQEFQKDGAFAKMILIENKRDLDRYFSELKRNGANLLIQEYIPGPDCEHYSYYSYRNSESKELVGIGVRKTRLNPIHGGAGSFIETTDSAELAATSRTLLDKLNYTGISSVCCKRHQHTGKLMLHEVNGRLPMGHATSLLSNINLPYIAYQDALGMQVELQQRVSGGHKWIALGNDFDSFRKYRRAGELSTLQWLWSLRNVRVCAEFGFDDLRPFVFFLRNRLRRARKRFFNRPATGAGIK
jgi:D-aspartate ligase